MALVSEGRVCRDEPVDRPGHFSSRAKRSSSGKRAYTADELQKLLRAAPEKIVGTRYGDVLFDLLRLGLLTGCRISELCDIRTEDVLIPQMAFRIPDGKTENARRIMPVHRYGWPIIKRRLMSASDEWLLPGLTPAGPDAKISMNSLLVSGGLAGPKEYESC